LEQAIVTVVALVEEKEEETAAPVADVEPEAKADAKQPEKK
jgi:hypothetical protein